MNPTLFDITVAIVMVAVSLAMLVLFQRYLAAASARRMTCMMTRLGLDPGISARGGPQTEVIMKEARSRCRRCAAEDFCERWIAGKAEGDNDFCPNARAFDFLAGATGRTG